MQMRYVLHFGPEALHIDMEGSLTFLDSRLFHRMMSAISNKESRSEIRMNVSRLNGMDSTGLRLMMQAHDQAKKLHRTLVFVAPQGPVRELLDQAARFNALKIAV